MPNRTHPVVAIYLLYGIGLEAHQPNTMVLFSPMACRAAADPDFGDGRTYARCWRNAFIRYSHTASCILPRSLRDIERAHVCTERRFPRTCMKWPYG